MGYTTTGGFWRVSLLSHLRVVLGDFCFEGTDEARDYLRSCSGGVCFLWFFPLLSTEDTTLHTRSFSPVDTSLI